MFTINTEKMVLLSVPGGKPNRKEEKPPRVRQPKQKSETCMYYAYKLSAICESDYLFQQQQKNRKFASEYRKSLSALHDAIKKITSIVQQQSGNIPKEALLGFLNFQLSINTDKSIFNKAEQIFLKNIFIPTIAKKTAKNIDLIMLSNILVENEYKASSDFLSNIGINPTEALSTIIKDAIEKLSLTGNAEIAMPLKNSENLSLPQKNMLMSKAVSYHMERVFNLESTPWKPMDDIQVLFNLIQKNKAPIVFYGFFGSSFYTTPSVKAKEDPLEGYEVYGWPPNTHKPKEEIHIAGHTITVVGVKKNVESAKPSGWVYYLDPQDPSEPNVARKMYKMSYEQFANYCLDGTANALNDISDDRLKNLNYGRQRPG